MQNGFYEHMVLFNTAMRHFQALQDDEAMLNSVKGHVSFGEPKVDRGGID